MEQNDSCEITVPVPPDADVDQIEKAIDEKLKSRFTDLRDCKEITIHIKFGKSKRGQ